MSALGAAVLLVTVSLLVLAGCSSPPERGGPVTLVLKHAKILGPVDPIPRLLTEFEAEHPGIRIKAEVLRWTSDEQRQFLVINLEGGQPGFDLMMLDCIWVPEFARAGWILDLSAAGVTPDELAAHFPSAVEAGTYRGRIWALPWFMNVGLLYYRSDLLGRYGFKPPETYGAMLEQIRVIRTGERNRKLEGYLWQGKQYEGLVVNVLEGLWADGSTLVGEDGRVFPDPQRAEELARFLPSALAQRGMTASGATKPTRMALSHEPELVRASPNLPRIHDLTLAGRSRPVTPYYVMMSTTLQPELSAALVKVKTPARSVADARRRLDFFLRDLQECARAGRPPPSCEASGARRGRACCPPRPRSSRWARSPSI